MEKICQGRHCGVLKTLKVRLYGKKICILQSQYLAPKSRKLKVVETWNLYKMAKIVWSQNFKYKL